MIRRRGLVLSLKLFTIDYKGLTLKAEQTAFDPNNWAKAKDFFDTFEFKSLQADIRKRFPDLVEGSLGSPLRCFDKLSMRATKATENASSMPRSTSS